MEAEHTEGSGLAARVSISDEKVIRMVETSDKPLYVKQLALLLVSNDATKLTPPFFREVRSILNQLRRDRRLYEDYQHRWHPYRPTKPSSATAATQQPSPVINAKATYAAILQRANKPRDTTKHIHAAPQQKKITIKTSSDEKAPAEAIIPAQPEANTIPGQPEAKTIAQAEGETPAEIEKKTVSQADEKERQGGDLASSTPTPCNSPTFSFAPPALAIRLTEDEGPEERPRQPEEEYAEEKANVLTEEVRESLDQMERMPNMHFGHLLRQPPQMGVKPPRLPHTPSYVVIVIDAISFPEALRIVPTGCIVARRFILTHPNLLVQPSSSIDIIEIVQPTIVLVPSKPPHRHTESEFEGYSIDDVVDEKMPHEEIRAVEMPTTAAVRAACTLVAFAQNNQYLPTPVTLVNIFSRDPLMQYTKQELADYGLQVEIVTTID